MSKRTADAIITNLFAKTINIVLYQTATRNAPFSHIKLHVFNERVRIIISRMELNWKYLRKVTPMFLKQSHQCRISVCATYFIILFLHRFIGLFEYFDAIHAYFNILNLEMFTIYKARASKN